MKIVDVCIPAFYPGDELNKIINRLAKQTVRVNTVWICNTNISGWKEEYEDTAKGLGLDLRVEHIKAEEFDHGRVRDGLIKKSHADYVLFMTQDAYPYDDMLIENMLKAFEQPCNVKVAACYGRQLPKPDSDLIEKYSRKFNYPKKSSIKSAADLDRLGIKTFFCSNVCAMYDRKIYNEGNGFPQKTIFNEDMIHARELINRGYYIAYAADARVFHSHSYTLAKQLHRNFDLAYSQMQYPEVFSGIKSESEGIRYVRCVLGRLMREGRIFTCVRFCFQCVAKYAGFFLGKRANRLPKRLVLWLTDSPKYFI